MASCDRHLLDCESRQSKKDQEVQKRDPFLRGATSSITVNSRMMRIMDRWQ